MIKLKNGWRTPYLATRSNKRKQQVQKSQWEWPKDRSLEKARGVLAPEKLGMAEVDKKRALLRKVNPEL